MPALAPLRVTGPAPQAPEYGLITTPETLVTQSDDHWRGGVTVDSYPPDTPTLHFPCSAGSSRIKAVGDDPPAPEFPSFTVLIPITCSGMGIGNLEGAELLRTRVREAFTARESFGVEYQLVFGDPDEPGDPHLADANLDDPMSGAFVSPMEGVALLEKYIGLTAQAGFLHIDPASFAAMDPAYFSTDGRTMKTKRGNTVIIGNGYIGAKPDGGGELEENQNWIFATGPVRATRDPGVSVPTLPEVFNHETNELTFRAERNYVVYWDTALQVGVPVERDPGPCPCTPEA